MAGMGRWTAGLVVLACVAFACGEGGTIIADDGGASDAGEGHDITFVPQLDGDGGDDAPMEWDGAPGSSDTGTDGLVELGEPTFIPPSGATLVGSLAPVTLVPPSSFPQAQLFYTLDGSTPSSQHGTRYTGPFQLQAPFTCNSISTTVTAVASYPGYLDSPPAAATYTVTSDNDGVLGPVTFSIPSKTSNNDFPLGLSDAPGGLICYTTDGTTPSCAPTAESCLGTAAIYTSPIVIDEAVTNPSTGAIKLTAIECVLGTAPPSCGFMTGPPVTQTYTLQAAVPTMTNPAPGVVSPGVTPTLATATVSSIALTDPVSIHMTTDGSTPTCTSGTALPGSSTVGPFTASTTLNAIACKTGYLPSNVATFVYTVQ
jgi:hypothetical protein